MYFSRFVHLPISALSLFSLLLSGCEKGLKPSQFDAINGTAPTLDIVAIDPPMGTQDVKLDQEITITFNQIIDPYSAHPSNFEIFSDSGSRLPTKPFVKTKFVAHPQFPEQTVSQIGIMPNGFFSTEQNYYVLWRDAIPDEEIVQSNIDPSLAGIRNLNGDLMIQGSTYFRTGKDFTPFRKNKLEILSMSPGKIISQGDNSQGNDLNGIANTYVSLNKRAPIRISFSEGIKSILMNDPGPYTNNIPPTTLDYNNPERFRGLIIGIIDANTPIADILGSLPDAFANPSGWEQALNGKLIRRLNGTVHTESGRTKNGDSPRRVLVFDPSEDYPDTVAQLVFVAVSGFVGISTNKPLKDGIAVGAFAHYSGFNIEGVGFPSIKDILSGVFGGGQPQ